MGSLIRKPATIMLFRSPQILRLILVSLFTLASASSLATVEEIKPGTPFTPLQPTRELSTTTQQIMNNLLRGHYEKQRLNDQLSSRILDIVYEDIDSSRSYLLQSDIVDFEKYRYRLDEALSRGDMAPAFNIYNRLQERISERLSYLLNELNEHAADYKFDVDESLDLDRENSPWASTSAELDDLWRKRLKNSILNSSPLPCSSCRRAPNRSSSHGTLRFLSRRKFRIYCPPYASGSPKRRWPTKSP